MEETLFQFDVKADKGRENVELKTESKKGFPLTPPLGVHMMHEQLLTQHKKSHERLWRRIINLKIETISFEFYFAITVSSHKNLENST